MKNNLKLTELFISDCGVTDITAEVISETLDVLELVWAENNGLSFAGAEMLVGMGVGGGEGKRLKVLNLEGNVISNEEAQELRGRFGMGYISV